MKIRSNRGFTLVELLVVIAVLGILLTIVTMFFGNVQKQARDSKRSNDMAILQNSLKKYYDTNGQYPFSCTWSGTAMVDCATRSASYQSSTGTAPISTIGSGTTSAQLRTLLPTVSTSFGDPLRSNNNPLNVATTPSSLYISKKSYFFLSMDLYNLGTTVYFGTNDTASTWIACDFSAISYDKQGALKLGASHYYVTGYFSEVQNKWLFFQGPFDSSLNNLRWNTSGNAACVPQAT